MMNASTRAAAIGATKGNLHKTGLRRETCTKPIFRLPPRASGAGDRSYEGQPAQNRCYEGKPAQNPILDYLREPPARSIGATKGNLHKTGATKGNLHKILILGGTAFAIPRRPATLATSPLCVSPVPSLIPP